MTIKGEMLLGRFPTPGDFDAGVSDYVNQEHKDGKPLTMAGALLWLGIYDEKTLDEFALVEGFDASVRRLKAIIRREYERQLYTSSTAGASLAMKNLGWTDKQRLEHTAKDGAPLEVKITFVKPGK